MYGLKKIFFFLIVIETAACYQNFQGFILSLGYTAEIP